MSTIKKALEAFATYVDIRGLQQPVVWVQFR
jgi:hypothetical protein